MADTCATSIKDSRGALPPGWNTHRYRQRVFHQSHPSQRGITGMAENGGVTCNLWNRTNTIGWHWLSKRMAPVNELASRRRNHQECGRQGQISRMHEWHERNGEVVGTLSPSPKWNGTHHNKLPGMASQQNQRRQEWRGQPCGENDEQITYLVWPVKWYLLLYKSPGPRDHPAECRMKQWPTSRNPPPNGRWWGEPRRRVSITYG